MINQPTILKIKIPAARFYVYTLAHPDGSVFYVGNGRLRRVYAHEEEALTGCSCHKCKIIQSIWGENRSVIKAIVFVTTDEDASLDYERGLIKTIGRDNLCNRSDGGEGRAQVTYMTIYRECKAEIRELRKRARRADYYEYFTLRKEADKKEVELERWLESAKAIVKDYRSYFQEVGIYFDLERRLKKPW